MDPETNREDHLDEAEDGEIFEFDASLEPAIPENEVKVDPENIESVEMNVEPKDSQKANFSVKKFEVESELAKIGCEYIAPILRRAGYADEVYYLFKSTCKKNHGFLVKYRGLLLT